MKNIFKVINVASVPHRSLFRYPGGKTWFVPYVRLWLRSLGTRVRDFCEPFAGGAIVGLSVLFDGLCERLTLVELDEDVAAVWQCLLSGDGPKLARRIVTFNVSPNSVRRILSGPHRSTLQRAFATILKNRVQRGGIMAPGASLMKEGENGKGLKSRWYPITLKKRILAIHQVRDRIRFVHGDGIQFLEHRTDSPNIAFYLDPPYTLAGQRLYLHSQIDHRRLFLACSKLQGQFLMTYDESDYIKHLAEAFGFQIGSVPMKNTHHEVKRELVVGNDLSWIYSLDGSQLLQNALLERG